MILHFLHRRLSDLAHVALHGSNHREHAAIRYALRLPDGAAVLPGVVRALGLLEEARRLAHEHESARKEAVLRAIGFREDLARARLVWFEEAKELREKIAKADERGDEGWSAAGEWSRKFHEAEPTAVDVSEAKTWARASDASPGRAALLLRLARVTL